MKEEDRDLDLTRTVESNMSDKPVNHVCNPNGVEGILVYGEMNFCIGSAVKYLWRAGLKEEAVQRISDSQIDDLEKAIWYIQHELKRLKKQRKGCK